MRVGARLVPLVLAALVTSVAGAQQILLDEPVRAGVVTVFPSLGDRQSYYYVPDRARLATGAGGLPQFSFLRYVENVRSTGAADATEGDGGGIVHAVVELRVTDDELQDAARELQRVRPGAKIVGPVVFRSGKFGLVSSFATPGGGLTEQVVGVGAAPILEGNKAAVSIQLTKKGSKILWESFHTATPDISFRFEMEMAGFRAPLRAILEADFSQIYSHRRFNAAVATPWLAAEIDDVFDELRNEGAIHLEMIGDDEGLEKLVDYAYRKLTDIMFQPAGGSGSPSLDNLARTGGTGGLLDKVTQRLADARDEVRKDNLAIREERRKRREEDRKAAIELADRAERLDKALASPEAAELSTEDRANLAMLAQYLQARSGQKRDDAALPDPEPIVGSADDLPEEQPLPEFSVMAVFEMRTTRRSDKYRLDLNQSLPDTLPLTFSENIGDLRRLTANPDVFRSVNLDDPLYKQRELSVVVDGANAGDFANYVNFVTVQLVKKHEGGDQTLDEVRIDRSNFSTEGNRFTLLYGWKGDNDRRRWLTYDYRALWSFFGGEVVEEPLRRGTFGAIPMTPPYQRRLVTVEATEPEAIAKLGVRAVTATLYYSVGGTEKSVQKTLRTGAGPASETLEIVVPRGKDAYEYQIDWTLAGNRQVSTGRKKSSSSILFLDELPEGTR